MLDPQQRAIVAISLLAAFADGRTSDEERERIRGACVDATEGGDATMAAICQDVLLGRTDLAAEARKIADPRQRRAAYEVAVGVCNADGATNAEERAFLERLGGALGIGHDVDETLRTADLIASAPVDGAILAGAAAGASRSVPSGPQVDERELDETIAGHAKFAAALELLPQTLATMAIVPVQLRLVHRIGKAYGFALDRTSIIEFAGAIGVGMTSQVVEKYARRIVGGLLGKALGGIVGGVGASVGRAATGAAMTYATTYGLGQVAKRYYGSGRTISMDQLRGMFTQSVERGRGLFVQDQHAIAEQAKTIDVKSVLQSLGGS
ncbi:MAG: DUF533 domain-containing protein [Phycisphaerales bacterium]